MGFWGELQGAKVQDQLTRIRLEVGEIRETVGRLEREKEERGEQIREVRSSPPARRLSTSSTQAAPRRCQFSRASCSTGSRH